MSMNTIVKKLLSLAVFLSIIAISYGQEGLNDTLTTAATAGNGLSTDVAVIAQGAEIFNGNCVQCHAIHEQVVGPKLANVYENRSIDWLINFIKYPEKAIQSGDEHAVALYEKYRQIMPNHDFLSDQEVLAILSYVQAKTIEGPEQTTAATGAADGNNAAATGSGVNTNLLIAVIVGLLALLVIIVIIMILLLSTLSQHLKQQKSLTEEDRDYINQSFNIGAIVRSPTFVGIVAFLFIAIAAKSVVDGLYGIGVQQGYAPEQPINFSHKLHAGYYEIDCKYCHTGVEKSKYASIPSANICMNCHNSIRTTSPEIQKIYAAVENNRPIEWIRVHNLPDLAYFNHSQHVKVGKLECQTCHGEVQEMEVVQQHSLLTMGWCISCHKKTNVNAKGNAYYDNLVELHNSNSKEPMVVEDIGGLECSKCHY